MMERKPDSDGSSRLLFRPLFPIIGLSVKVHHGQHDNFGSERNIYETKPIQAIASHTRAEELPSFRIFLDAAEAVANFPSELCAKARQDAVIVSHRIGQFGRSLNQEPNIHGVRCLASTSSASSAVVSPRR
jgi:hypothetical protein